MDADALKKLLAAPAATPPNGTTANFEDPPNRNGLAWAVTTVCTVVLTLCFCVRLYARVWMERSVRVEEVLMICAYGAYWGTAYAAYALIYTPGYYVHTWNLTYGDLVHPLYLILIYGCCYSVVLPLLKTAILLDWCRVFVPGKRLKSGFWWACAALSAFQLLWGILCILLLNLQCRPHAAIWQFYLPSKCYDLPKVMLGSASVQVITDLAMVLLPQRIIWGLHLNWQKKMGVSVIFGVGILALVAACFRLSHTVTFSKTADRMYFIGPLLFWACAEMTCGFFILSTPCLPKILAESGLSRGVKSMLGLSAKSTNDQSGPNSNYGSGYAKKRRSGSRQLSKSAGGSADTYYKMPDDGLALTNFDAESQERLQEDVAGGGNMKAGGGRNAVHVTKTTQVTISDSHSGSDVGENLTPWAKRGV